eukprot:scaffold21979_cov66-Phaeocystis_antarctica.AAC.11
MGGVEGLGRRRGGAHTGGAHGGVPARAARVLGCDEARLRRGAGPARRARLERRPKAVRVTHPGERTPTGGGSSFIGGAGLPGAASRFT